MFSTTTEYAIRLMQYMSRDTSKIYAASDLYEKLDMPKQYVSKILNRLSKAQLLETVRGKYGGFKFARKIESITLMEIVSVFEQKIATDTCVLGFESCNPTHPCCMHDKFIEVKENSNNMLLNTTLLDLSKTVVNKY
jgi:Rrf2 family protein